MGKDVNEFAKSCHWRQRCKGGRRREGLLQSLPVPSHPWEDISIDINVGLPSTKGGKNVIFTFVDRLTRMVHLVCTTSTLDAQGAALLYVNNVLVKQGQSKSIVSDRDGRFTSAFWQELFTLLGTELKLSTAHYPLNDGQTETMNRLVEDTHRVFVSHRRGDRDEILPQCEFAINNSDRSSTGETPLSQLCSALAYSSFLAWFYLHHCENNGKPSTVAVTTFGSITNSKGRYRCCSSHTIASLLFWQESSSSAFQGRRKRNGSSSLPYYFWGDR